MKTIAGVLAIAGLLLCTIAGTITGVGIMIYDLLSGGDNFMQGFTVFSLSATLLLVTVIAYMVSKLMTASQKIADVLEKTLQDEMNHEHPSTFNPLEAFFRMGAFPGQGTIKMATIDENGNFIPLGEKQFSSHEELIKHRNDILSKSFQNAPKKLEDMTNEELKQEEKKAVDSQNFELAACIVNLIQERTKAK